jgi:hypothetical protein
MVWVQNLNMHDVPHFGNSNTIITEEEQNVGDRLGIYIQVD